MVHTNGIICHTILWGFIFEAFLIRIVNIITQQRIFGHFEYLIPYDIRTPQTIGPLK